ncbi:hypothetical protein ACN47E_001537 [Coniothyrium glycines]
MSSLLRLSGLSQHLSRPLQSSRCHALRSLRRPTPSPPTHVTRTRRAYTGFTPAGDRQIATNKTILYTLIGTNVGVFLYAMYLKQAAQQGHPKGFVKFMQNMTLNLHDFKAGRYWTPLTSCFTHLDFGHILSNLVTVFFLGRFLAFEPLITPARYLVIALGSGVAGSLGFLVNRMQATQGARAVDRKRALGFSGAVMGISTVAACLSPRTTVSLYGIIPVPLWALVMGYAAYDGYYLNSEKSTVAHAGHLGGLVFGGAYYLLKLRGLRF